MKNGLIQDKSGSKSLHHPWIKSDFQSKLLGTGVASDYVSPSPDLEEVYI
jgi:hypothetical protein